MSTAVRMPGFQELRRQIGPWYHECPLRAFRAKHDAGPQSYTMRKTHPSLQQIQLEKMFASLIGETWHFLVDLICSSLINIKYVYQPFLFLFYELSYILLMCETKGTSPYYPCCNCFPSRCHLPFDFRWGIFFHKSLKFFSQV